MLIERTLYLLISMKVHHGRQHCNITVLNDLFLLDKQGMIVFLSSKIHTSKIKTHHSDKKNKQRVLAVWVSKLTTTHNSVHYFVPARSYQD